MCDGPGGALHQTLTAHPDIVTTLTENLRQRDPAERQALLELRAGDLDTALAFYADNQRITFTPQRTHALAGMVDAWATDRAAGHDTFMLAWRRQSVADLNRIARHVARHRGWLTGPDMNMSDGRAFAVGDLVVTLAPNYRGQLVTSERGTVTAVDPDAGALTMRTDHGRNVTLLGPEIGPDRLAHGYALTVHREQGATSDRTHYLAEGGGRKLAYVALSRARDRTTMHAVADDLDQALDDIRHDWTHQHHDTWLTPATAVGDDPRLRPTPVDRTTIRRRLVAELEQLHALAPPEVTTDLTATEPNSTPYSAGANTSPPAPAPTAAVRSGASPGSSTTSTPTSTAPAPNAPNPVPGSGPAGSARSPTWRTTGPPPSTNGTSTPIPKPAGSTPPSPAPPSGQSRSAARTASTNAGTTNTPNTPPASATSNAPSPNSTTPTRQPCPTPAPTAPHRQPGPSTTR